MPTLCEHLLSMAVRLLTLRVTAPFAELPPSRYADGNRI